MSELEWRKPCDQLPGKTDYEVLVTIDVTRNDSSRERIVQEAEYFSENDPAPGVSESGFYKYDYYYGDYVKIKHPVIAWMPYPEPFKD